MAGVTCAFSPSTVMARDCRPPSSNSYRGGSIKKIMVWCLIAGALLLSNECFAANAFLELQILRNGHVRFNDGPELDGNHLAAKIRELMRQSPRPDIHIMPNKAASYTSVAAVLAAFQRAGYGPHFGFAGYMK
jgi:hypothetical protein